jgi:CRISPR-associated protein (TIGR03986 family)
VSEFHHLYHFIPFDSSSPGSGDLLRDKFPKEAPAYVTHDRHVVGTKSGRLLCRLSTMTPIVVGAEQKEKATPTEVKNFEIGGRAAIPASTLRGLISNIAEAASNSAFRVLDRDRTYSYRKSMDDPNVPKLSALGMIHEHKGKLWLRPLTIPTLTADRNGEAKLDRGYERLFPKPVLRVYLGDPYSIRDQDRAPKNTPPGQYVSLPLAAREWLPGYRLADDQLQYRKPAATRRFVLAQLPVQPGAKPQPFGQDPTWTGGIVRALGCWPPERRDSIPNTKKHELFLPVPTTQDWPIVQLSEEVVETFHALAKERLEASIERWKREKQKNPLLPFEPYGTRPERYQGDDTKREIRLKTGDVVYFRANESGAIVEISFSSIWRGKVPGKTSEFFPARLLPFYFNSEEDKKAVLTPADLLFGFVESRAKDLETERTALALASRVRFASAQTHETHEPKLLKSAIRKILDSPKPPSPSFYFRKRQGAGAVTKAALNAKEHQAQGRKVYLHHKWQPGQSPWETQLPRENVDQKATIRPVDANQEFYFHLDFDNLSDTEFRLLLYALRPSDGFQHKLGMGKALGLGSVKIDVLGFFEIDRQARYSEKGLDQPRYARMIPWAPSDPKSWPNRYELERETAARSEETLEPLRDAYRETVPAAVRKALELLGDPANLEHPVSQPLVTDSEHTEKETFQWYVANERSGQPQWLRPIGAGTTSIPTLRKVPTWTGRR